MNNVRIVKHPLLLDKVSRLRDKETGAQEFRQLTKEISIMLAVAATDHLPLTEIKIATPLETTTAHRVNSDIVLFPILRAGLGMVEGFLSLLPMAKIGYLGVCRNEKTLAPVTYYQNLPKNLDQIETYVLDPMLATGGSANYCLSLIKEHGGRNMTIITIISAPEGLENVSQNHPDVRIVTASLDRELNGHGYILPGLGDAGDRLNGTF
jgi:uracil phosphoribosyltransferase